MDFFSIRISGWFPHIKVCVFQQVFISGISLGYQFVLVLGFPVSHKQINLLYRAYLHHILHIHLNSFFFLVCEYVHVCVCVCLSVCLSVCLRVCVHVPVCCVCVCMCVCACMSMCVHVNVWACVHVDRRTVRDRYRLIDKYAYFE